VRQLNLYNFHKIKNPDGFIEFAHDRFRRGQLDSLQFITRKVGQETEALKHKLRSPKPISYEYNRLLGIIRNLENSLQVENKKSEQKSKENSELVREIERTKLQNSKRTRKLLFLVWIVTNNFNAELMTSVKELFVSNGVGMDYELFDDLHESKIPVILDERTFNSTSNSDFLIDQLLVLVSKYHNSKATVDSKRVSIENLLINFEEGETVSQNAELNRYFRLGGCARSDFYSLDNNPLDQFPSVCNFSIANDQIEQTGFVFEHNSRKSQMESIQTTFDFDDANSESCSFRVESESKQSDFFDN